MEHIITRRRGFRKLLAFLLCMASILGLLPAQAFAMSVGQTASSWLGDQYVGSDGNHYRAPAPYTYLAYHTDGTIDVHTSSGGNAYRHYIDRDLIVSAQREALQTLRCIISNLEYRFYKAYGMEIEDKRTVYGECTYRLVPREDEPSVCLMHDWIYLPSA